MLDFLMLSLLQAFPNENMLLNQNNKRGDFMALIGRQDDSAMLDLLNQEWYSIVGGNFTSTAKYRAMKLGLPLTGSAQDFSSFQNQAFLHFFRSDHYAFWNIKNTYSQTGLKAVFITDSCMSSF